MNRIEIIKKVIMEIKGENIEFVLGFCLKQYKLYLLELQKKRIEKKIKDLESKPVKGLFSKF